MNNIDYCSFPLKKKQLRQIGARFTREEISRRAHNRVCEYLKKCKIDPAVIEALPMDFYKAAIHLCGELRVLSMMAEADEYWREKTLDGVDAESRAMVVQYKKKTEVRQ